MTREKGEMLKTGYLEVVHAATAGVIPLNEDEEHGVDPEEISCGECNIHNQK